VREPEFTVAEVTERRPLARGELLLRGALGALVGLVSGALVVGVLEALKSRRENDGVGFDMLSPLGALFAPEGVGGWSTVVGLLAFAAIVGMMTAAVVAARHGDAEQLREAERELAAKEST
jgi:hypothetical protein